MKKRLLILALLLTVVAGNTLAANLPGQTQYIVKRNLLFKQPNASAPASIQDVVRTNAGRVDMEFGDRLIVTLPDQAAKALSQNPAVQFMQRVVSGVPAVVTSVVTGLNSTIHTAAARLAPESVGPSWSSGTYSYDGLGNITGIGTNSFTYDAFSRLTSATVSSIQETYTYDRYGNLTQKVTGTGATALTVDLPVDIGGRNHLSGHCYDAAGNLTDDKVTYPNDCPNTSQINAYDALNMLQMKRNDVNAKEYYVYDANDQRIAVLSCGTSPTCSSDVPNVFLSFRDESGKVLRQFEVSYQAFDQAWTWVEDYVYRDGVLLASETTAGGRRHFHVDHLASARLITDNNGHRISEHDYFPFGVEITPLRQEVLPLNGFSREEPMKFTGHERDFTIGTSSENANYLDYMHARSTLPQWGRFLSVDPNVDTEKALHETQRWNRYAYVNNNPVTHLDPDGRDAVASFIMGLAGGPAAAERYRNVSTVQTLFGNPSQIRQAFRDSPAIFKLELALYSSTPAGRFIAAARAAFNLPSTTTVYRAVDSTEAADIAATGHFRPSTKGTDYKGFFFRPEDAADLGTKLAKQDGGQYTVVSGRVPRDIIESAPPHNAAGEGPGVLVPNNKLKDVIPVFGKP